MTQTETGSIESVLKEDRVFEPAANFSDSIGGAYIDSLDQYHQLHKRSVEDPSGFWSTIAEELDWSTKWSNVLEWNLPDAKWFVGGKTNICHNCIDRQINSGHGNQLALIWEGEPMPGGKPEIRNFTYNDLKREVCKFANFACSNRLRISAIPLAELT